MCEGHRATPGYEGGGAEGVATPGYEGGGAEGVATPGYEGGGAEGVATPGYEGGGAEGVATPGYEGGGEEGVATPGYEGGGAEGVATQATKEVGQRVRLHQATKEVGQRVWLACVLNQSTHAGKMGVHGVSGVSDSWRGGDAMLQFAVVRSCRLWSAVEGNMKPYSGNFAEEFRPYHRPGVGSHYHYGHVISSQLSHYTLQAHEN